MASRYAILIPYTPNSLVQATLLTQLGLRCVQARASEEQAHRLGNEKAALINTVRKLNRDVAKLDNFKRNLLNSLQADEEVSHIQCASFSAHAIKFLCIDGALENQIDQGTTPCNDLYTSECWAARREARPRARVSSDNPQSTCLLKLSGLW